MVLQQRSKAIIQLRCTCYQLGPSTHWLSHANRLTVRKMTAADPEIG
jgi:hypothetical protein